MSKVERYDCVADGWNMMQDDEGHWVFYEDYAALHDAVQGLIEDVRLRYPSQELYCPHMRVLDELTSS